MLEALNQFEELNISEAHAWVLSPRRLTRVDPFDEAFVRTLHRRMFNKTWRWAGKYRTTQKINLGVAVHEIRERLAALLGNARYWVDHKAFCSDEIAVRFHHELTIIHAFPNGNGRHARLYADVIAPKLGAQEFTWGSANLHAGQARDAYIQALKLADAGDFARLFAFSRA